MEKYSELMTESINGLSLLWDSKVSEAQKEVLRDMVRNMVTISGGSFWMGAKPGDYDGDIDERPGHSVTLSTYLIGKYELTQREWMAVMGSNPSFFVGEDLPVDCVSWEMINDHFLPKLRSMTGLNFRLPSEAEWEFAARGGNCSCGYIYSGSNSRSDVAWHMENSDRMTHPVGQKLANELGLFDMSGNVWEWCNDWYSGVYYSSSPSNNPMGPVSGTHHVLRGGGWTSNAWSSRVLFRHHDSPTGYCALYGLRLALSLA
ncbi:MAG: SUMF1/EgtB/PvdO family nonheme iron enzyme [Marinifilaceae bacterium]|nr:SUMF1/EgtB/PvdO family nonheme iron enzyme [Marinifilaceae bacterium]